MDFVPSPDDRLHAILYDLVMGPTHARVVELDGDTALLRTADLSQAMLLVRKSLDANRGIILRSQILGLRDGRLEILLVGGAAEDRKVLRGALPMFTTASASGIIVVPLLSSAANMWEVAGSFEGVSRTRSAVERL